MQNKQIIMNCSSFETRVALIESGIVTEYYIERPKEKGIVGNIYKGKVIRVLPGMQSAFIDIGLDRAAFLYGGDIISSNDELNSDDEDNDDEISTKRLNVKNIKISDLIKEGQEIIVQVAKDAIGTKGARVTTYLSLPGRYVVLMPNINHIGVSRKIKSEEERERLKKLATELKPEGTGIIVRTVSENVDDEKIISDITFLAKIWEVIKIQTMASKCPSIIHEDLTLIFRATRDLMGKDVDRIVIDNKNKYHDLVKFLNRFSVKLGAQVQLYQGNVPVFDAYGIELDLSRALQAKVWLKSGGYLIIEQTEALTAIDVNTGRYVGNKSLDDTIVKTNLEAVKEIVLQLRLRNIGGIVVADFIDMDRYDDREKIFIALQEELKKDKSRTSVLRISEMGVIQMTRKRTEESLSHKLCTDCPYCLGRGEVKSSITVCYEILREISREFDRISAEGLLIKTHQNIADRLYEEDKEFLDFLKEKYKKTCIIKIEPTFHIEQYEIVALK